jgi:hypothetical protein
MRLVAGTLFFATLAALGAAKDPLAVDVLYTKMQKKINAGQAAAVEEQYALLHSELSVKQQRDFRLLLAQRLDYVNLMVTRKSMEYQSLVPVLRNLGIFFGAGGALACLAALPLMPSSHSYVTKEQVKGGAIAGAAVVLCSIAASVISRMCVYNSLLRFRREQVELEAFLAALKQKNVRLEPLPCSEIRTA